MMRSFGIVVLLAQLMSPLGPGPGTAHTIHPAFVNFTANVNAAGVDSTFVMTAPSSIVNGDMLIAGLSTSGSSNGTTINPPAGWSSCVAAFDAAGAAPRTLVFTKIAKNESGNYTFTVTGGIGTSFFSGSIAHFKNTVAGTDVCGAGNTGTGTTATALSVNSATAFDYLVFIGTSDGLGTLGIPAALRRAGTSLGQP